MPEDAWEKARCDEFADAIQDLRMSTKNLLISSLNFKSQILLHYNYRTETIHPRKILREHCIRRKAGSNEEGFLL